MKSFVCFCIISSFMCSFVVSEKEEINNSTTVMNDEISSNKSGNDSFKISTRKVQFDPLSTRKIKFNTTENHINIGIDLMIKKRTGYILGASGLVLIILVIALCCYIRSIRKRRR